MQLISTAQRAHAVSNDRDEKSILPWRIENRSGCHYLFDDNGRKFIACRYKPTRTNAYEAAGVANCEYMRKFVQEPSEHKDAARDHLSVVLGFAGMLSSGGNEEDVARFATDHGWLDANGQLTTAGDQLARALLQQSGTRTVFRV